MRAAELHRLARLLRELALETTGNTDEDRVNAGELAVLDDLARHPGATIRETTERTGLAQSLVSRIVHAMAETGVVTVQQDAADRRKVRVQLTHEARAAIVERADRRIEDALAAYTPELNETERASLRRHLAEASRLLRKGNPRR